MGGGVPRNLTWRLKSSNHYQLEIQFEEKNQENNDNGHDYSQLFSVFTCVLICMCELLFSVAALRSHPVITKYGTQIRGLTAYVLTQDEMIKKHYPVKGESHLREAG